jgi:phage host-nuclease inhibitor protein Gam
MVANSTRGRHTVTTNGKVPPDIPPPTSLLGVAELQIRMSELLGSVKEVASSLATDINALEEEAAGKIEAYKEEILRIAKVIEQYAEANREALTGKTQTVVVAGGGEMQWYKTPQSVRIAKDMVEEIIKRIKRRRKNRRRLMRFIRVKESLDLKAMLKEPELAQSIAGVVIASDNKFAIRPPNRDERVEHNITEDKWAVVVATKEQLPKKEEDQKQAA